MLFEQVVDSKKLCEKFKTIRDYYGHYPAREMLERVFEKFNDKDGNFLEQFQTTGFDARLFELYIFAYLYEEGFEIKEGYNRPDFIVGRNGKKVAIELTTVNYSEKVEELKKNYEYEFINNFHDELAIRFGSALYSKLNKKYWELEHCKNMPLVIAIEAFYDDDSLQYSSSALINYLYGIKDKWYFDNNENLIINKEKITTHNLGEKEIPSGFFELDGVENISAVIFTNSGTVAKFQRMGYLYDFNNGDIIITRSGKCYDNNPNSTEPIDFMYEVGNPYYNESFADGLIVCLNPNAKNPVSNDFFINTSWVEMIDNELAYFTPDFHVYNSKTSSLVFEVLSNNLKKVDIDTIDNYHLLPRVNQQICELEYYLSIDENKMGIIVFDFNIGYFSAIFYKRQQSNKYWMVGRSCNYILSFEAKLKLLEYFELTSF